MKKVQDVKRFQSALGMLSYRDLKAIITLKMIKDNQISPEDINLAETVFGKSMGEIKGKIIRHNRKHEDNDTIDIPEELIHKNKHLEVCIYTMYVTGLLFLTSTSHELYYRTTRTCHLNTKKTIYNV